MAKNSQLFFEFDIDLQILSVRPSDTFRKAHIALQEQGKINSISRHTPESLRVTPEAPEACANTQARTRAGFPQPDA